MKHIIIPIFITLFIMSCASNKTLTNLDSLSKSKRERYLIAKAKETVLKYGPDYYRDYKKPEIIRGQISSKAKENVGRIYYNIQVSHLVKYLKNRGKKTGKSGDNWI
jgi:hypothetical protein